MKYFFPLILLFISCNKHTKFDSAEWKSSGGEGILLDTRMNMVDDLIKNEILLNKDESEIVELIGSPSRLNSHEHKSVKYFAVQEVYGWNIDPEELIFLKIEFDEKGKSISVETFSTK